VNGFIFLLRLFSFHYIIVVVPGRTRFLIDVHEFDRSVFLHCRIFNVHHVDSAIQSARNQLVQDAYGDRIQISEVRTHTWLYQMYISSFILFLVPTYYYSFQENYFYISSLQQPD